MSSFNRLVAAAVFVVYVSPIASAAVVTMSPTLGVVRTQTQGAGTYDVYDFFWTNDSGAEFAYYRIIANAVSGSLMDPAKLQDDRQTEPQSGFADGNTRGHVDTWVNTVWSAVGKDDFGYFASISVNPGSYAPTGSGVAAPFTYLDWTVFDTLGEDDNDLSNAVTNGPADQTAPYHLARILTTRGATASFQIHAYDTSQPTVPDIFTFGPEPPNMPPTVDPEQPQAVTVGGSNFITAQFTATDFTPHPPITFSNAVLANFVPLFPGSTNPAFNGTVAANGNFTWDTTGFRPGVYTINVTATENYPINNSSTGGGLQVIKLFPEPSSALLSALTIFGAIGMHRHRKCASWPFISQLTGKR